MRDHCAPIRYTAISMKSVLDVRPLKAMRQNASEQKHMHSFGHWAVPKPGFASKFHGSFTSRRFEPTKIKTP